MKIATNFVSPLHRAVMPLVAAMWLAALALAGVAWWLLADTAELRGELPQLRQRFERIATGVADAAAQEHMPPAQELAETRKRVAKINAAARTKGVPSTVLLSELETQLPPDAWLSSLHYRASEGEVRLVASARSAEPLSSFLLKLERSALFEAVMLMRETQLAGPGQASVQFEIRLKVRS